VEEGLHSGTKGLFPIDKIDIEGGKRDRGVVMLLSGQALEGSPFCCDCRCAHLTLNDVKKLTFKDLLGTEDRITRDLDPFYNPQLLSTGASNYEIVYNLGDSSDRMYGVMLTALPVLYAGIHASSWNGYFPTYQEAIIWRIAVCSIAAISLIILPCDFLMDKAEDLWVYPGPESRIPWGVARDHWPLRPRLEYKVFLFVKVSAVLVGCVLLMIYCFSRCYLVIESFISVRRLPMGAYSTVSWVNFLPHIG
jgi:hypothetical protein